MVLAELEIDRPSLPANSERVTVLEDSCRPVSASVLDWPCRKVEAPPARSHQTTDNGGAMKCCYRPCENEAQFHYDTGAGWAIDLCKTHADILDSTDGGYSTANSDDNIYGWYLHGQGVTKISKRREAIKKRKRDEGS